MNSNLLNQTVAEVVQHDYRTANVFKAHKIDFCCGGDKSIKEVCSQKNIDENQLKKQIDETLKKGAKSNNLHFNQWPLDLLAIYIEKIHHKYVEENSPSIKQFLRKLVKVHGHAAPELVEIEKIFHASAGNLTQHMKKEEFILFPFIEKMEKCKKTGHRLDIPYFNTIVNPIEMMKGEHMAEGEKFRQIEDLSQNFLVPDWGCNTYHVTMQLLRDFHEDLQMHIHLENNILFPKAIALEAELNQQ